MGGLMQSARAAQVAAAGQTILGGNDSVASSQTAYADEPAPAPAKSSNATAFTPTRPILPEEQMYARSDDGMTSPKERLSGKFDQELAEYKQKQGLSARPTAAQTRSPFALGGDTEENPLQESSPAGSVAKQRLASIDSMQSAEALSGKMQGKEQFGTEKNSEEKPKDLRVVQNASSPQKVAINPKTPDGHTKHDGEIEIEKIPQIDAMIEREAKAKGVNPRWLKIIAFLESSGNPKKVTGSYVGLFQFGKDGWKDFGQGGDRLNPEHSIRAAIREFISNHKQFLREVGREPTLSEMYLMHQQGYGGAKALIKNPDVLASKIRSLGAIEGNLSDNEKPLAALMKSRDFLDYWDKKFTGGTGYNNWYLNVPNRP